MDQSDIASKEILIDEAVAKLSHFAKLYGIRSIFIVGGYCRDKYLNRVENTNNIDVASAFEDQAIQLAGVFASEILNKAPTIYKKSGAAAVDYSTDLGNIKIEFQGKSVASYMNNQEVRDYLHESQIKDIPLMNNIYGRDFTINTLIMSLYDGNMYDPTDLAVRDLKRKSIVPLLPPEMLVKYNPIAILRAIRFALTYDFTISPELRSVIKSNTDNLLKSLSEERMIKEIIRILKIKGAESLEMLQNFNLAQVLLTPEIKKHLNIGDTNG